MQEPDETRALVRAFSDKSRKLRVLGKRQGNVIEVPHKFTDDGSIPDSPQQIVVSRLHLDDLRFLKAWRDNSWDNALTQKKLNLPDDQAEKTFKKLAYFKTEDARIKALASEATPERVLAKDMENMESGTLNDSQHKSLDRVAKITGAFKTVGEGSTINIFNMPRMSPDAEAALRIIADKEADVIDAEAIG